MLIVEKKITGNGNAAHEQLLHNRTHQTFMIPKLAGIPIANVKHFPNPKTLRNAFNKSTPEHERRLQNALQSALKESRKSRSNKEIEMQRLKSVLESRIGGNAPLILTSLVYPRISYPGQEVPKTRRSNIRKNNDNVRRPKNSSKSAMPITVRNKYYNTVISPL
uniref:Uncharacterized protein n=1 Tax=viral metagenome TaxID=1070528 RepID=A0A6C0IY51_9ZZZZ